jgi:hypothetical protein
MYQSMLALLVTALCVDSLTLYSSNNMFVFNMLNEEQEDNVTDTNRDPPPHSEVAKMARYIVHNSGTIMMNCEDFPEQDQTSQRLVSFNECIQK